AGLMVACVCWKFTVIRRRTLRGIDLASYAITILGLSSSIFAVHHMDEQFADSFSRLQITSSIADMMFDVGFPFAGTCAQAEKDNSETLRSRECRKLHSYLDQLYKVDIYRPSKLPAPKSADYTDADVQKIVTDLAEKVREINARLSELGFA